MTPTIHACVLMFLLTAGTTWGLKDSVSSRDIRRFLARYDSNEPPSKDKTTHVRIGLYINDVAFNHDEGTMKINCYMRMSWQDKRFLPLFNDTSPSLRKVLFGPKLVESSWKPDIFFRNAASSERVNSLVNEQLFKVNRTGHVWYVVRMLTTLHCPLLRQGHRQLWCPILFESFAYTMDTVTFNWLQTPVDVDKSIDVLAHTLHDIILYDCSQNYTAGSFPCLEVRLMLRWDQIESTFDRGVYFVSCLLVIVSWLGFWMQPSEKRIFLGIGVTIILAVLFVAVAEWRENSFANRTTQVQIWILFCTVMVLGMVLEYALVFILLGTIRGRLRGLCYKVDQSQEDMEPRRTRCSDITDLAFGLIIFPLIFVIALLAHGTTTIAFT